MKREVIRFLESVWLKQPHGVYACVAWKEGELWRQKFIHRDDIERAYQNRGRDLYFCPNLFTKPQRTNECAAPSRWAYADLDEVDVREVCDELGVLLPTMWWETSPGRYQALWELNATLSHKAHAKLNQHLTYKLNADLNGWPMSKVLRIPGSVSTKWSTPFRVHMMPNTDRPHAFSVQELWQTCKDVKVPEYAQASFTLDPELVRASRKLVPNLPKDLQQLLRRRMVRDRSQHVFLLAKLCIEAKLEPEQAAGVIALSPVAQEKYGGRLLDEIQRLLQKVSESKPKKKNGRKRINGTKLPGESLGRLLAREIRPPGWLVGGIWSTDAHGMIAGEEKTFKSLLVQDLAVSVATGTSFLNHFPVPKVGPVVYVQEENQVAMVQDRFLKIALSRNAQNDPRKLPIRVVNNYQMNLTADEDMELLHKMVSVDKAKLLILDPFYLMAPGVDENNATEVGNILRNLLQIKQELDCGILIVHHYKKQDRSSPMVAETARISGSAVFGRWYESLVLVERGDEDAEVKLYAKHRMHAAEPPVKIRFEMGDMGDYSYEPRIVDTKDEARDFYADLKAAVKASPGITIARLAQAFEMRPERMARQLRNSTHFEVQRQMKGSPMVYLRT